MLVDKDADVNAQDKMGVTPLGIAKSKGFHECVKILEGRKNARPSAQESAGRSDFREQCLSDLTSMSVKELKAMLRMNILECPSGLEKHELADYFLEQIMEKTLAKVCGTDDGDVIVTARPSSSSASSAAARPGPSSAASTANELRISSSSAAARPGPSPSSTSAHAAKGTARTSSSSAAAQPLSPSASPAAARPGRSTSSTSAKQANDTSRSSSSSAAAQPGPCSAVNEAFQKIEDSKGGPDEVQHPSNAAAQPPGPRPAVKACLWCGATEKRLKRCGGCETAWLCGKDCQQQAWPSHRAACKEAQRRA
ncbi:hypothetical protein DUNSADRAFT_17524 [Dunaliella salina]|uniref:MYND-type domain-containing protein n=1 Tax=Dunaliella salina TaxID=3046 RepID=A0ABQ7GZZ5_DUNSA|nr:hypothetical protein DUNSADRAFT_17524 [Dunaliella salina]|eukprot:KAF5840177.1 hypothetical protein DUNSADRAFT_17524 [Dunaliella salina]